MPHHSTALGLDRGPVSARHKRPHPLPASLPKIAPPERFSLRDRSEPIKGEVPFSGHGEIVPHEWRETSPSMGEVGGGGGHIHKPIHLIPRPETVRILFPITPHGRPAGEQWRGEPGGGFASPTGSSPDGSVCATGPCCSKNRHSGTACVSFLFYSEASAVSGSARLLLGNAESLPSWRAPIDNRSSGGACACLLQSIAQSLGKPLIWL
jgi:hypothetical protein